MPSQRKIIPLSELPLRNDFMFGEVMRTSEICQLFLEELLGIRIQRIEFIDKQEGFIGQLHPSRHPSGRISQGRSGHGI